MRDSTVRPLREDRTGHVARESDASRLAWELHHGQRRGQLPAVARELIAPSFAPWTQPQVHRESQRARHD